MTQLKRIQAIAAAVILVLAVCNAQEASADDKKLDVKQSSTMADVLGGLTGMTVEVTLRSGVVMTGKVGSVQQNLVVLSELRGKEFFDAVVRIEDVSAVSVRVRGK